MRKNLYILLCIVFLSTFSALAQQTATSVEYKRTEYSVNIMSKFPFVTKDRIERTRQTWGKRSEDWFTTYHLYFNREESIYNEKAEDRPSTYAHRKDYFIVSRNFEQNTSKDLITFNSQDYLIEGESVKYKWKILNEIKEVAGYICMKAETYDPMRKVPVVAWFTSAIPSKAGPEGFGSLPGLILELVFNENDVVVTAQKVSPDIDYPKEIFPKKFKAKTVTPSEYQTMYIKFVESGIKKKDLYLYWDIRY